MEDWDASSWKRSSPGGRTWWRPPPSWWWAGSAARLVTSVMARGFMAGLQADPSSWASTTGAATSNPWEETRHEWAEP